MIKDVIDAVGNAARKILSNWGATLISFVLYLALLAVLYFFFSIREATKVEVMLSILVLPLAAIVFFFVLQAIGLSYVRIGVGPGYLLKRALKDCWKLLLVSLPLILLAGAIIYFSGKLENKLAAESGHWKSIMLDWSRIFLLYFVLPLLAIHLWIAAIREGLGGAIRGIGHNIARAFAPRSVLTYLVVIAVFGAAAYFLFFTKTPAKTEWAELWLFGGRLAAGLILVFLGWLLALGSLAELTARRVLGEVGEPQ